MSPPPAGTRLAAGTALTREEANALAAHARARIVLPLGPRDVGKTTLMVEFYERFVAGSWGDSSFVWSETLLDFELLAFPGRLISDADIPDTWRTRLEDETRPILHLRLASNDSIDNVLFVNLSGELSDRVRNGRDPSVEIPLLSTADRVLICVDGSLVAESPAMCSRAASHTHQLLRVLSEKGSFAPQAQVTLVLTKWDVVDAATGAAERWDAAEHALLDDLDSIGRGSASIKLAARSLASQPAEDGMVPLLKWVLAPSAASREHADPMPPSTRAIARDSDNDE